MAISFLKKLFNKQPAAPPSTPEQVESPDLEELDNDTADDFVKGGNGELPKLWNGIPSRDWTFH